LLPDSKLKTHSGLSVQKRQSSRTTEPQASKQKTNKNKIHSEAFLNVSYKVLIIDDEDDIREVAALSLESVAGWEVVTASNGTQGIAVAEAEQPDAILLDVMMPGMDGPTTFGEMRKNPATASIPVLLLTAKVQASDHQRFAGLGVKAVLSKPFDPITLSTQIAEVLGWE